MRKEPLSPFIAPLIARSPVIIIVASLFLAVPGHAAEQSFDEAVEILATELAQQAKQKGSNYLAVVGFAELNGYESAMTDLLSEELVTAFFGEGSFNVVERSQMNRVLDEFEGYAGGNFDEGSIAELQKLLGVDAIVTGSIARLGSSVRVNARIIDMETAQVFGASSTSFFVNGDIETLLSQSSGRTGSRRTGLQDPAPAQPVFRNDYYAIMPTAVLVSDNGKKLKVAAELRNLTNEPLRIAARNKFDDRSALTDRGSEINLSMPSGISNRGGSSDAERYTVIEPGSSTILTWTGRAYAPMSVSATIEGTTVNLREILYINTPREIIPTQVNLQKLPIE